MSLSFSPLTKSLHIATSGMVAQNQRILVITQNLANIGIKAKPGEKPYQRQLVAFKNVYDPVLKTYVVRVKKILKDKSPPNKIYSPGDPFADKNGYVYEANMKSVVELTDMREASRSHESNIRAFEKILSMLQNTIGLLKG